MSLLVRSDLIDVYIFRRSAHRAQPHEVGTEIELLQLRRNDPEPGADLHQTWQPIMGHVESIGGTLERAIETAARELLEETGLDVTTQGPHEGLVALEQIHPYFLPSRDAIMLTPRFAVGVAADWEPTLNDEHDAWRWVQQNEIDDQFMWPGQRAAIRELIETISRGPEAIDRIRVRF